VAWEVPPDAAIDAWLASEAAHQRHAVPAIASIAWGMVLMILAVPLAVVAIGSFWIMAMLFAELIKG
jgi:hypothetical protein